MTNKVKIFENSVPGKDREKIIQRMYQKQKLSNNKIDSTTEYLHGTSKSTFLRRSFFLSRAKRWGNRKILLEFSWQEVYTNHHNFCPEWKLIRLAWKLEKILFLANIFINKSFQSLPTEKYFSSFHDKKSKNCIQALHWFIMKIFKIYTFTSITRSGSQSMSTNLYFR